MSKPLKPSMTIEEQIGLLQSRGMEVDTDLARQWLANVSYYRLSAYWHPARERDAQGALLDRFVPGTDFRDAADLYEADRKLRTLLHDGMERVEIALRTRLGAHLCTTGPLSYTDPHIFRPSFDHTEWMRTARRRIDRAGRHNEAIKHYRDAYGGHYPFWVLAEVLDFSDASRLYQGLHAQTQREIAEDLGIHIDLASLTASQQSKTKKQSPLVRWFEQLTIIRNTCAHHARLWNKSFAPAPTAALRSCPDLAALPEGQSERLFGTLVVMSHLLRVTSPGTGWPQKAAQLLTTEFLTNPLVTTSALGISAGWDGHL